MKLRGPLGTLVLIASVGLWTGAVSAQEIHTFHDLGDDSGGAMQGTTVLPGAPTPTRAAAPEADGDGADVAPAAVSADQSYHIAIHGAQPRQGRQNTAQVLAMEWPELYRGIIPGQRDLLPHLERAKNQGQSEAAPNQLTWIGFLPEENRTRVFFQGARAPQYTMQRSADGSALTITFQNARLPKRNFSRFIDTSYFERTVTRIETKAERGNVIVTVQLKSSAQPAVNREGEYLFFDFSHSSGVSGSDMALD